MKLGFVVNHDPKGGRWHRRQPRGAGRHHLLHPRNRFPAARPPPRLRPPPRPGAAAGPEGPLPAAAAAARCRPAQRLGGGGGSARWRLPSRPRRGRPGSGLPAACAEPGAGGAAFPPRGTAQGPASPRRVFRRRTLVAFGSSGAGPGLGDGASPRGGQGRAG